MNITDYLGKGRYILPDDPKLQYCGRIGRGNNGMPEMVFPCTYVKWRFKGSSAAIVTDVRRFYFDVYMGCFIDGVQYTVRLHEGINRTILLKDGVPVCNENMYQTRLSGVKKPDGSPSDTEEHEIVLFKRQDACNIVEFCGIELDREARLLECGPLPEMKIEVYGDSVSAGEVSEALDCAGKPDPEGHEGVYSNSWYSYSWITARKLNARLHDIAQGGIPLLDGTGWYGSADGLIGMESIYDKIRYSPDVKHAEKWDFSKYIPDVVVVAIGQNDAHPDDFMKTLREAGYTHSDDFMKTPGEAVYTHSDDSMKTSREAGCLQDGEKRPDQAENKDETVLEAIGKAHNWKQHYAAFLSRLREHYPKALIVCATTILCHDEAWDNAIDDVVNKLNDPKIRHFLYSKNGCGTPGHIRANEAEEMAEELAGFIRQAIRE